MRKTKQVLTVSGIVAGVMLCAIASMAQMERSGEEGRRGRTRDGDAARQRTAFDPEQMRARMMDNLKQELAFSDEEWTAVSPLLEDVMQKQRDAMGGFGGGFTMRRADGATPEGGREATDRRGGGITPDPSAEALRTALSSDETSAADIKAKLDEFRKSRDAKEKALEQSREALRAVCSVRQEATLVLRGYLK